MPSKRRYTCIIAYQATCCDETHLHDRTVDAGSASEAAVAAWRGLLEDIPTAEIAADEVVVIEGAPKLLGVLSMILPSE